LAKSEKPYISNPEDLTSKTDTLIRNFSKNLFDLKTNQHTILSLIAKHGPLTEYKLAKLRSNHVLNRDLARRIIRGRETSDNSLVENNYLIQTSSEKFKSTGKIKKTFGLSLKGFLASLAHTNFSEIYLIKHYQEYLQKDFRDKNLALVSIELIKYNVLMFLAWHNSKGLSLSKLKNTNRYALDWILSNDLMNYERNYFTIISKDKTLLLTRDKFFSLVSIATGLIKQLEKNHEIDMTEIDFTDKDAIKKRLWRNIQQWPLLLESIQRKNRIENYPNNQSILVSVNEKNLKNYRNKILSNLKIKNLAMESPEFPLKFII